MEFQPRANGLYYQTFAAAKQSRLEKEVDPEISKRTDERAVKLAKSEEEEGLIIEATGLFIPILAEVMALRPEFREDDISSEMSVVNSRNCYDRVVSCSIECAWGQFSMTPDDVAIRNKYLRSNGLMRRICNWPDSLISERFERVEISIFYKEIIVKSVDNIDTKSFTNDPSTIIPLLERGFAQPQITDYRVYHSNDYLWDN